MPDAGEHYLGLISNSVNAWNKLEAQRSVLSAFLPKEEVKAQTIARSAAHAAIRTSSLANLLDDPVEAGLLNPNEPRVLAYAVLGKAATDVLEEMRIGSNNFADLFKRVKVTVVEPGVRKGFGFRAVSLEEAAQFPHAKPGSTIEGKIRDLKTVPEVGGTLQVSRFMVQTYVIGLVDPETGKPRVNLDVYAKDT